jgi:microcystin-dependent protein
MNPFIGEIKIFAGNFAPRGWAFCDGQLMSIIEYQELFSILGTNYGNTGDGRTSFNLPDLRGRVPIHQGEGYRLGQPGGSKNVTLTASQMPNHTHTATLNSRTTPITATATLHVNTGLGDSNDANNNYLATGEAKNARQTYPISNGYSTSSTSKYLTKINVIF